jgi:hypothetical protein
MYELAGIRPEIDCGLAFAPCLPEPEKIVCLGFRGWMLGLNTGDIASWERTWDLYCGLFGTAGAREAVSRLSQWVTAVGDCAYRDIGVFPQTCRSFSRDECLAVSMIAACQHLAPGAVRSCARALIDSDDVAQVTDAAESFANALASVDHILSPPSLVLRECGGRGLSQNLH